ncbi:hypothetical protein H6G81_20275 [Scytonema hofmannii FACHB-248]|uniref:Uncharacterized protein n=1 Tax=Scytonema hofmannii FACHB-248 TaxID=1842502 RepID=A0ABR8GUH2_9CYAN|nr:MULTISPECIES: hypothetical protein [Nostocales]MBD2606803.1 hypothetical protein [Scytonema hofmannii FACHB-248]
MVTDNSIVRSVQLMHYHQVAAGVDKKAEVLVDGGIRRGTDISPFKVNVCTMK